MEQFMQSIINYVSTWGYLAIFVGTALGTANIPVPSEVILGFAGYLVFLRQLDFTLAAGCGIAGGVLGSVVSYLLGYYGGRPFVKKYGKYFFMPEAKMQLAERWFERYGVTITLLGRMLPVVRTFVSLPAGFARMNFLQFFLYTLIGTIPWTIGLVYAGLALGENWQALKTLGHEASLFMGAVILITAGYFFFRHRSGLGSRE